MKMDVMRSRNCANKILENNGIDVDLFHTAVNDLLLPGRSKNHNL